MPGVRFYRPGRIIEWQHGLIMLAIGLALLWPDPTMKGVLFQPLTDMMPERAWAALMLFMGVVRCTALIVNGTAPRGSPMARMAVSVMATPVWMLVAFSFWSAGPVGFWAAAVYAVLVGFELRIMWTAARDLKD